MPTSLTCPEIKAQYDHALVGSDILKRILEKGILTTRDYLSIKNEYLKVNEIIISLIKNYPNVNLQKKVLATIYKSALDIKLGEHRIGAFDSNFCSVLQHPNGERKYYFYNPTTDTMSEAYEFLSSHDSNGFWCIPTREGKFYLYNPSSQEKSQLFESINVVFGQKVQGGEDEFWSVKLHNKYSQYNPVTKEFKDL